MAPRTLPREPWRGSMLCGMQMSYGMPGSTFCAERKADNAYACEAHWDEMIEDGESLNFAPGNAYGEPHWAIRLLWEPAEGEEPIEASAEEMALYAPLFV